MNWTKQEIENSKSILELGERKEMRYGDWFINVFGDISLADYIYFGRKYTAEKLKKNLINPKWIPLWTWQDCREWLKKKGYRLFQLHEEFVTRGMKICLCGKTSDYHIEIIGKTDTEAIQKCVIKVLEEEKGGLG